MLLKRITKAFAEVIRDIRKNKGLSQRDLAQRSELHINTIHLIEIGKIEAKLSTLLFLAKGLGLNLDELMKLFLSEYFGI